MQAKPNRHAPQVARDCERTRLAESSVAAVDVCASRMVQIHVRARTVRMTPRAMSELLGTLGHAVAKQAARRTGTAAALTPTNLFPRRRGEA
ncbi:MAG: hypothetical protein OXU20_34955 [Myxococcales bacterium]|nr:hypothetical protein [Myxococcales bacterium]MDD9966132.1 hypothetical protein [Myxococcales bacterium]